jgi:hypothetical protein
MKKKFVYILVGLTVILLLINLIINWTTKSNSNPKTPEAKSTLIDSLFKESISKFNLDSNWVEIVAINSRQYDSLSQVYKIKLPGDLRPAVVLQELKEDFSDIPVKLISDEKVVNGYTTLNILSNDYLKLQASIKVENQLERPHSKFAFVLKDFYETDEDAKTLLYHSIIPFSILLVPSEQSDSLLKEIDDFKKTYSILIDDGIDTPNYALETKFTKTHLKESIRYISWGYPAAEIYTVNDKSELFNSAVFNFIKDEFTGRSITLYALSDFTTLPSNISEAKSLLNFYQESSIGKAGKIIMVPSKIFVELQNELLKMKKRGTRFYSPRELISLNAKTNTTN